MSRIITLRIFNKWVLVLVGIFLLSISYLIMGQAKAASLTETFIQFNRIQISTPTTGTVCVNQTSSGTDASVQVTFPTGYTVSTTTSNWAVNTTNTAWPTGGTAWPGIGTATNVSGQVVTFPSTTLTPGTLYCFNWTNSAALSTASSASNTNTGTIGTYTSTPTLIDSGSYVASTVTSDQIAVSATIPVAFSFALSGNTDPLGTLTTSAVATSPTPRTVTINTNAHNGWQVWAKDANTGLNSPTAAYTLPSTTPGTNSTLAAGTAGYNMGVTSSQSSGNGTITVATPFVGGSTGRGGGLNTTLSTIATSTGSGAGSVLTLTNNTAISATTPAASDYTDTETIIGAGLF